MRQGRPKRKIREIVSSALAVVLITTTAWAALPQTAIYAATEKSETNTGLGTGSIINPTGAGQWCYVYYGNKIGNNYVRYRVLDKAATEYGGNTMLLDCDYLLENKRFDDDDSNVWANSEIKGYLNAGFLTGKFDAREQAAIAASKKNTASSKDGNGWKSGDTDYLSWTPLVSDDNDETLKTYIFLLDAKEATSTSYGYQNQNTSSDSRKKNPIGTTSAAWWWLRSLSYNDTYNAGGVNTSGTFGLDYVAHDILWLSPAFNLNRSSVIFSSCVVGTPGQPGAEYKLTIKDDKLGITPGDIVRDGTTITVPYEITGDNKNEATQVSVLIMDSAYSAGTATTSGYTYTKLSVNSWNISGTGTFTLPDKYVAKTCGTDYHAYILAEDVIAGNSTDYASTPVEIIIPDINVPVSGVTISPKETELKPGASQTLTHTIAPDNATNKNVTWSTSKPSVATVDNDGKVTAVDEGEAIITVTTVDGDFTDTCRVIVRKDAPVIKECTITFDPNGGKGDMDPQKADKGETVQLKANEFTRSGYSFMKWNTEPDGSGKDYDDKASVKLEDNMTLYAQWKENEPDTYCVTVKTDGKGEATASPKSGKTGDKINLSADADKDWRFVKWKVVSGDIRLEDPEDEDTSFVIGDSDIVVKAVFEKEEHKHDDDDDDDEDEPAKPAAVNPDTVEGFFAVSGQPVPGVAMGKTVQGVAAQAVFNAARPAGYLQAFTFNMAINGKVEYTLKNGTLTIIIPKEFQKAGRTFAIMALDKNGKAWTFADTDTNPNTVTATINVEGYAFALIYKD